MYRFEAHEPRLLSSRQRTLRRQSGSTSPIRWCGERGAVTLATPRSQGYADLVVHAKIDTRVFDAAKNAPGPRTETRTLRYDGPGYAVREEDAWWLTNFGF